MEFGPFRMAATLWGSFSEQSIGSLLRTRLFTDPFLELKKIKYILNSFSCERGSSTSPPELAGVCEVCFKIKYTLNVVPGTDLGSRSPDCKYES
jgi:hypothetical protein